MAPERCAGRPRLPYWLGWGVLAAAAYLATAFGLGPGMGPIFYDGLIPLPPYRWVHPPASVALDNQPPDAFERRLAVGPQGSPAAEVATDDDQAIVTFPAGAIVHRPGESAVRVRITPLDPATVGPPPRGQPYDGNAYRFEAVYAGSGAPAMLTASVTVVLRYAVHATRILRRDGEAWVTLSVTRFDGSQQVLANSDRLGTYVAAAGAPSR